MTDVITKVAIGWVEYPFAGWGSEGQEVVYLTQAEYDELPASKLTDGKIYKIKTSGVAPTPGGGTAVERGDIVFATVAGMSEYEWVFVTWWGAGSTAYPAVDYLWNRVLQNQNKAIYVKNDWTIIYIQLVWSYSKPEYRRSQPPYSSYTTILETTYQPQSATYKMANWYIYIRDQLSINPTNYNYYKVNIETFEITSIDETEYNNITEYWKYYKWLYYSVDWTDLVSKNDLWTEIKRYTNIIKDNFWITNDIIYAYINWQSYAMTTL